MGHVILHTLSMNAMEFLADIIYEEKDITKHSIPDHLSDANPQPFHYQR